MLSLTYYPTKILEQKYTSYQLNILGSISTQIWATSHLACNMTQDYKAIYQLDIKLNIPKMKWNNPTHTLS